MKYKFKAATPFYNWSYICKFVTINQVWTLLKYEMKWFCKMIKSICENWRLSFPQPTTCFRKCDILSVGQVDTATKYSSLVHPKLIKGWRKWAIGGEQALRKRATRVTPVNLNASSLLPCIKLVLLEEDRAWELLSACSGVFCDITRAAGDHRVEGLAIWEEFSFRGEVERDALLMVAGPGSRLDISIVSGSLGSTNSTFVFGFSSYSPSSSSVISMISISFWFFASSRSSWFFVSSRSFRFFVSFWFFASSRSFSKAALVGCKEGHQFDILKMTWNLNTTVTDMTKLCFLGGSAADWIWLCLERNRLR